MDQKNNNAIKNLVVKVDVEVDVDKEEAHKDAQWAREQWMRKEKENFWDKCQQIIDDVNQNGGPFDMTVANFKNYLNNGRIFENYTEFEFACLLLHGCHDDIVVDSAGYLRWNLDYFSAEVNVVNVVNVVNQEKVNVGVNEVNGINGVDEVNGVNGVNADLLVDVIKELQEKKLRIINYKEMSVDMEAALCDLESEIKANEGEDKDKNVRIDYHSFMEHPILKPKYNEKQLYRSFRRDRKIQCVWGGENYVWRSERTK